jgi:threonylcarbamoyladenosine tRNA methylthiotransferase MtaB
MAALRALAAEKTETHRRSFLGRDLDAITLHTPAELASQGRTSALTENFLPVEIEGRLAANRRVRVRMTGLNAAGALEAAAPEEPAPSTFFLAHSSAGNTDVPV